jgi:hypothetical protein
MNYDYQEAVSFGDHLRWALTRIPVEAYTRTNIYMPILIDQPNRLFISTIPDRQKVVFEIGILLESEVQAMNLVQYLRYNLGVNRPYYINNALLEVPIPSNIFNIIINKLNINYNLQKNEFNEYLNKKSSGRITYKKNLSSGNYLYFFKFGSNVLCRITDVPSIEKNMDGKSVITTNVKFNLEVEFFNYTNFITESEILDLTNTTLLPDDDTSTVAYTFAINMPLALQNSKGFNIMAKTQFITDINVSVDKTNFKDILTPEFLYYLEYLDENSLDVNKFVEPLLFVDNEILPLDKYTIDWKTFDIILNEPLMNYVYTFALYLDSNHFNTVVTEDLGIYDNGYNIMNQKTIK